MAAIDPLYLELGWRYLPIVLASSLIMLAWALVINNLGRRRYPVYWYKLDGAFLLLSARLRERQAQRIEQRRRIREEGMKEAEEGSAAMTMDLQNPDSDQR